MPNGNAIVIVNDGTFTYNPTLTDTSFQNRVGPVTLRYRVKLFDADSKVVNIGPWKSYVFNLESPANGLLRLEPIGLRKDTGYVGTESSFTDGVTVNPSIAGRVAGVFGSAKSTRVDFDHDTDGMPEGFVKSDATHRTFVYDPRFTDPSFETRTGNVTIRYRLKAIDDAGLETIVLDWTPFSYVLQGAPASEYTVDSLAESWGVGGYEHDFGVVITGSVDTHDPNVTGTPIGGDPGNGSGGFSFGPNGTFVGDGNPGAEPGSGGGLGIDYDDNGFPIIPDPEGQKGLPQVVVVQFDHDYPTDAGYGIPDGKTTTRSDLSFKYFPRNITTGDHIIRGRALQWSNEYEMFLFGAWTSEPLEYTVEALPSPPVEILGVRTVGETATPLTTLDPAVIGKLTGPIDDPGSVVVRVEWNYGTPDLITKTVSIDKDLGFYAIPSSGLGADTIQVRARSESWDPINLIPIFSEWINFEYTYAPPAAPSIVDLRLLVDNGTSATDKITSVGTVIGTVSPLFGEDIKVYFDVLGNGTTVDGIVVSQSDGTFVFTPGVVSGAVQLSAYVERTNPYTKVRQVGLPSALNYTLVAAANVSLVVSEFSLEHDTGSNSHDNITSNATVVGKLANDGPVAGLDVQIAYSTALQVNATVRSSSDGTFRFTRTDWPIGPHTIFARGIEYDPNTKTLVPGPWKSLAFELLLTTNVAPTVSLFTLLNDSDIPGDLKTRNTSFTGKITDDTSVSQITIQLDLNNDGVFDATTTTDINGQFVYEATGLTFGNLTVAARAVEFDQQSSTHLVGVWKTLAFTYENQAYAPAKLSGLIFDNGAGSEQLIASVAGQVTSQIDVTKVSIEVDFNGDAIVDYFGTVDRYGKFKIDLPDLPNNTATLTLRTQYKDPIYNNLLISAWTPLTINYIKPTVAAAQILTIGLVNDDGTSTTDKETSDSRLKGTVDRQSLSSFVTVEFDYDGDSQIDASTVVQSDLTWTFAPQNLGAQAWTIQVRTKDQTTSGQILRSTWQTFTFTLVAAATSGLRVSDIALGNDVGSTVPLTYDRYIIGTIAGGSGLSNLKVEFDHDGDGTVDGSAMTSSESFYYYATGLDEGIVNFQARVTTTTGLSQTSAWKTFSFVYHTDPDGNTAKQADVDALVAALEASLNQQSTYNTNVNNQKTTLEQQQQTANNNLDQQVDAANGARNQEVSAADADYRLQVAAADAAYRLSLQNAAAAFNASNFPGNRTSFDFTPLAWPESPNEGRFTIPADNTQPAPPVLAPTYDGPQLDLAGDALYQAGLSVARNQFDTASFAAKRVQDDSSRTARETYNQATRDAEQTYRDELRTADENYRDALEQEPSTDLRTVQQSYQDAIQVPLEAYRDATKSAYETLSDGVKAAQDTLNAAHTAAWHSYNTTVNDAYEAAHDAWEALIAAMQSHDCDESDAIFNTAHETDFDAWKTLLMEISTQRKGFDDAVAPMVNAYQKAIADAQKTYSNANSAAANAYDHSVSHRDYEIRAIRISATVKLEKDRATATRKRSDSIADATKTRDLNLASYQKDASLSIEAARVTFWQTTATLKQSAYASWSTAVGTPWPAYELKLVNNEVNYYSALSAAHTTRTQTAVHAEKTRLDAVTNAEHSFSKDSAKNILETADKRADAQGAFWGDAATEILDRENANADERRDLRDQLSDLVLTRTNTSVDDGTTYAGDVSTASDTYSQAIADATELLSLSYIDTWGQTCTYLYSNQGGSTGTNQSISFSGLIRDASYKLYVANVNTNDSWVTQSSTLQDAYQANLENARKAQTDTLAGDNKEYQKTTAQIDHDFVIESSRLESVRANAKATSDVTYIQAVAPADKTRTDTETSLQGTKSVQDANALKAYRLGEATNYASAMTAWNGAVNTPWTAMHAAHGTIEVNWAVSSGNAEIGHAVALRMAENNRAQRHSLAQRDQQINLALREQSRIQSTATAKHAFVNEVADAKLSYAITLAGAILDHAEDESTRQQDQASSDRNSQKQYVSASRAAEKTFQLAMAAANNAYESVRANSHATFFAASNDAHEAAWEARRNLPAGGDPQPIYDQFKSDYNDAIDDLNAAIGAITPAFDTAAHQAWDVLRAARATTMAASNSYWASRTFITASLEQGVETAYFTARVTAERTLAAATRVASEKLGRALAATEKTYVTQVENLDAAREIVLANTDSRYSIASLIAANQKKRDSFIANAAQREDRVAVRGIYETALYNRDALLKQAAAVTLGNQLSQFQYQVALADAARSNDLRIARVAYEDSVSYAGLAYLDSVNSADQARAVRVNMAEVQFIQTVAPLNAIHDVALAHASIDLAMANAIADAAYAEQNVIVLTGYSLDKTNALNDLRTAIKDLGDDYGTSVGDAREAYYLDVTDHWNTMDWSLWSRLEYVGFYSLGNDERWFRGWGIGWGHFGGNSWVSLHARDYGLGTGYVYDGAYDGDAGHLGWIGGGWYGYGYSGYAWNGWGYGYGWGGYGYGYGWYGGYDADAWQDLSDSLSDSDKDLTKASKAEEVIYVKAIGDAQIDRATGLGNVKSNLAAAQNTANVIYATTVNTIDMQFAVATSTAKVTREQTLSAANRVFNNAKTSAEYTKVSSDETSNVTLRNLQGTAAVNRATSIAQADANYQISTAYQVAQSRTAGITPSSTNQQKYDAAYSVAKHGWLQNTQTAQIARATSVAFADGKLAYDIAVARRTRNVARAGANQTFVAVAGIQDEIRANSAVAQLTTRDMTLVGIRNVRRLSNAQHTQTYENEFAGAEGQYAIDVATAEKAFQIQRLNDDHIEKEPNKKTRRIAVADAQLDRVTSQADAKLDWQQDEATTRKSYTEMEALATKTYSIATAGLDQTYTTQMALAAETREVVFAGAEATFWNQETAAKNLRRTNLAIADRDLWTIREQHRVTAHTSINTLMGSLPWTQYLVAASVARRDWWNSVVATYIALANDRNTAETNYTTQLAAAYLQQQQTVAGAERLNATNIATAQYNDANTRATSVYDYVHDLAGPAETYAKDTAQHLRDLTVDSEQARRDYADSEDDQQLYDDLQLAADDRKTADEQSEKTWYTAESIQQANKLTDVALADFNFTSANIGNEVALTVAKTNANKTRHNLEAAAYLQSAIDWANIDAVYRQYEANTFVSAATGLANAAPSPWSTYDSQTYAAQAVRVTATSNATRTRIITQATSQKVNEVNHNNSEAAWQILLTNASGIYRTAIAGFDYALALGRASSVASLGQSGGYRTDLPITSRPIDRTEYASR